METINHTNRMQLPVEELVDFVENASIPLHWVDGNGTIIWANQAELDALGYSREEYVGQPISDFHADEPVINDILTRLTNNETLVNYRARLKCKDGSVKHVLINSNVFRKAGEFIHTRCFTRDISDMVVESQRREELLQRLEESEEKLKMSADIIASSYDAIISKDLNNIVTSWNKSAERTFGYTADEMIGNPLSILLPTDRLSEEQEIYERLQAGEVVQNFETKRVTKDKRVLDVSLSISPIKDKDGQIIGLSKIVRDITEKKQEEQRKSAFVSFVSHELKTPLTSILGFIQLLLSRAKSAGNAFDISALGKTEQQARRMATIVHDFLSVDRLEAGNLGLSKTDFSFNSLATEVVEEMVVLSPKHKITYRECGEVNVHADREKIGQVLSNLVTNAVKYSPDGSSVSISCQIEGGLIRIEVKDNGIGISEKDQVNLFDRYYRVDNQSTRSISGFGIGLFLVSEILRLHGTKIDLESTLGAGSKFSFRLPIA
nr:PAS domain S-box protein [Pedobacter kyonggii]